MTNNETHPSPKTIGRYMLFLVWGIILVGLFAFFADWEGKQNNPNQRVAGKIESGVREITLEANRFHHYVATGFINNTEVTFLIDTGATDVSVPESLANRIGLRKGMQSYAQTANGVVNIWLTTIDTLKLGNLEFYDVRASINPGMDGDEVLLGMSALRHVELIQKDNKLTLRQTME